MRVLTRALCLLALAALARPVLADEIHLKDGKTFYGTIVGYDNKMFKVKTDFGFIYVERDKIASIIPNKTEGTPSAGANAAPSNGANGGVSGNAGPAAQRSLPDATQAVRANAVEPTAEPAVETVAVPPAPRVSSAPVRPQLPANAPKSHAIAPSIKSAPPSESVALTASVSAAPLAPAASESPQIPEEVQGNTYTNHVYGFRMYKAPSWQLIDNATELPNAIVAMGTQNESTLLVVGREKTKQQLDSAANTVEKRLQDVYTDYQKTSQRKMTVGGLPAVEYRYRGKADEHDWSGTLVVVARGSDIFTALGMTFADTDLIQIQENVIAKAIASLDFSVR
ncbi:MAG TPA: hypothetical protein VN933_17525 [Candidatus Eremiobacteraceae bacterium]|jgi:hypothetical protein|nr:hypothetical protein [Candidatus Eremiobacteraceae bacterium]